MKKDKLLKVGAIGALALSVSVVAVGCNSNNSKKPDKPDVPDKTYTLTIDDADGIIALTEGDTATVTAALDGYEGTDALNFVWNSSAPSVATVTNGVITAVSEGTATITVALQYEGETYTKTITINVSAATTPGVTYTLSVSDESVTLEYGATKTVTASINDVDNPVFTWTSDNEQVATVANGVITYVGAGTATITVSIEVNGQTYSKPIAVTANEKQAGICAYTFNYDAYDGEYDGRGREGTAIDEPDVAPTKESTAEFNFTFDGWYVEENGEVTSRKWDFETDKLSGETLVLAPKFTEVRRSYTVNLGGEERVVLYGALIEAPAEDPQKEDTNLYTYTFAGWFVADADGKPTDTAWNFAVDVVTGNVTIVAKFDVELNPDAVYKASLAIAIENADANAFTIYDSEDNAVKTGNLSGGAVSFVVEEELMGTDEAEGFEAGTYKLVVEGSGYDFLGLTKTFEVSEDAANAFEVVNVEGALLANPYAVQTDNDNNVVLSYSGDTDEEKLASLKYTNKVRNIRNWFKHNLADGEMLSFTLKFEEEGFKPIADNGQMLDAFEQFMLCSAPGKVEDVGDTNLEGTRGLKLDRWGKLYRGHVINDSSTLDLNTILNTGRIDREMDYAFVRSDIVVEGEEVSRVYLLQRPHGGEWTALGYQDLAVDDGCYVQLNVTAANGPTLAYSYYNLAIENFEEQTLTDAIGNKLPYGFAKLDEETETYSVIVGAHTSSGGAQALPVKGDRTDGVLSATADVTLTSYSAFNYAGNLANRAQSAGLGVRDEFGHYFNVGFDYSTQGVLVHTNFNGDYGRRLQFNSSQCARATWINDGGILSLPDSGVLYFNPAAYPLTFAAGDVSAAGLKGNEYKYSLGAQVQGDIFTLYVGADQDNLVKIIELDMVKMYGADTELKLVSGGASANTIASQTISGNNVQFFASQYGDGAIEAQFDNMSLNYYSFSGEVNKIKDALLQELDAYVAAEINNNTITEFATTVNEETEGYNYSYSKRDFSEGSVLEGFDALTFDGTESSLAALQSASETIRTRSKTRAMAEALNLFKENAIVDLTAYATAKDVTLTPAMVGLINGSATIAELQTNFESAYGQLVIAYEHKDDFAAFNAAVETAVQTNVTSVYEEQEWYGKLNANAKSDFDVEADAAKAKIYAITYDLEKSCDENIAALNANPALAEANAQVLAAKAKVTAEYTVTLDIDGNTETTINAAYGSTIAELKAAVPAPTKESDNYYNYAFSGWGVGGEVLPDTAYVEEDITLTAMFASVARKTAINYTFVDKSNSGEVTVAWRIKDAENNVVASGKTAKIEAQLSYGEYKLTSDVTADVYGCDQTIVIDAAKLDTTDTANIELNHNNWGINNNGVASFAGTSDSTFTARFTSGNSSFFVAPTVLKGQGIKVSLRYNEGCGSNLQSGVNESDRFDTYFKTTFGGQNMGLTALSTNFGGTATVLYPLENITHNLLNEVYNTYDLAYVRQGDTGYFLGKMSTDEHYNVISSIALASDDGAALNLQVAGAGGKKFDYTYSNFEFLADSSAILADAQSGLGKNYRITPMAEGTTDIEWNAVKGRNYGMYVDKAYSITAGKAEITYHVKSITTNGADTFVGFTLCDPATGNFFNVGFPHGNTANKVEASVETGNGWSYRFDNIADKEAGFPSISLNGAFEFDYKAVVDGDEWQLFISQDGGATWKASNKFNVKAWMQSHQSEGKKAWADTSKLFPMGTDVCFGVYIYGDGEHDMSISNFNVNYMPAVEMTASISDNIDGQDATLSAATFPAAKSNSVTINAPEGYIITGLTANGADVFNVDNVQEYGKKYLYTFENSYDAENANVALVATLEVAGTNATITGAAYDEGAAYTLTSGEKVLNGTVGAGGVIEANLAKGTWDLEIALSNGTLGGATSFTVTDEDVAATTKAVSITTVENIWGTKITNMGDQSTATFGYTDANDKLGTFYLDFDKYVGLNETYEIKQKLTKGHAIAFRTNYKEWFGVLNSNHSIRSITADPDGDGAGVSHDLYVKHDITTPTYTQYGMGMSSTGNNWGAYSFGTRVWNLNTELENKTYDSATDTWTYAATADPKVDIMYVHTGTMLIMLTKPSKATKYTVFSMNFINPDEAASIRLMQSGRFPGANLGAYLHDYRYENFEYKTLTQDEIDAIVEEQIVKYNQGTSHATIANDATTWTWTIPTSGNTGAHAAYKGKTYDRTAGTITFETKIDGKVFGWAGGGITMLDPATNRYVRLGVINGQSWYLSMGATNCYSYTTQIDNATTKPILEANAGFVRNRATYSLLKSSTTWANLWMKAEITGDVWKVWLVQAADAETAPVYEETPDFTLNTRLAFEKNFVPYAGRGVLVNNDAGNASYTNSGFWFLKDGKTNAFNPVHVMQGWDVTKNMYPTAANVCVGVGGFSDAGTGGSINFSQMKTTFTPNE